MKITTVVHFNILIHALFIDLLCSDDTGAGELSLSLSLSLSLCCIYLNDPEYWNKQPMPNNIDSDLTLHNTMADLSLHY